MAKGFSFNHTFFLSNPFSLINKVPLLQSIEWLIKLRVDGTSCNVIGMIVDNVIGDGTGDEVEVGERFVMGKEIRIL